jgi:hypothetical protein
MNHDNELLALLERAAQRGAENVLLALAEGAAPYPQQWLTPERAAEYVGLSVPGLERMRREGTGPVFSKVNARVVRYRLRDLDDWLAKGRTERGEVGE